jgi:transposase
VELVDAASSREARCSWRSRNRRGRKKSRLDRRRYALRYCVEVFFCDLKRCRAIATRFEKTSRNYLAIVQLACSVIRLRDLLGGL